jgi:hypothetical protein
MNLPFGTIYAFSVFLPMEALPGIGRAQMSLVSALATITLTVGMNLAPRLPRLPPIALVARLRRVQRGGLALTRRRTATPRSCWATGPRSDWAPALPSP